MDHLCTSEINKLKKNTAWTDFHAICCRIRVVKDRFLAVEIFDPVNREK